MKKAILLGGWSLFFTWGAYAQEYVLPEVITLEQAIDLALTRNKTLQLQRQQVTLAENNAFPGNAGLLPTVRLLADGSYASNQSEVDIRTFQENPPLINIDENGVEATRVGARIQADYVLIAGLSGRFRYRLLQEEATLARQQQEAQLQEVVLNVARLFLDIARLQSREELLQENVTISENRLARIRNELKFGQATGSLVLNAQTDINQDLNALDEVRLLKNNLIKELNFLLDADPASNYQVSVTYQVPATVADERLKADVVAQNPELKAANTAVRAAEDHLKLQQSDRYPRISAFANYGYYREENDVQQLALLENLGYGVGLSFRYTLFRGGQVQNNVQNARIRMETAQLQESLTQDEVVKEAVKENSRLRLLQNQLAREEQNLPTYEDNFARMQQRFENGNATSLDVQDAQRALLRARIGINDTRLSIIQSALQLEKLRGDLLKIET